MAHVALSNSDPLQPENVLLLRQPITTSCIIKTTIAEAVVRRESPPPATSMEPRLVIEKPCKWPNNSR